MNNHRGQRVGTTRFSFEGYNFHRDSRYDGWVQRFVCAARNTEDKCRVKLWRHGNRQPTRVGEHYHIKPSINERAEIIDNLREEARASNALPNQIVNSVFRNLPRARAVDMRPEAARRHIHRERRLFQPPIPRSFEDLGDMLDEYPAVQATYRGANIATDGSVTYMFGSTDMIDRLSNATEIYIDGTFRAVPHTPRAAQLVILYLKKMDVGIPILYVLCSSRTTAMYNSIWQYLIQRVDGIVNRLRCVVSDFEAAIIYSVMISFPMAQVRGCWFHCIRAMTRKWKSLRLPRHNDQTLRQAWAMPLVPPDRFPEAIAVIVETAEQIEQEHPNVLLFIRYLCQQWLPLSNIVSVWNSPWRTNNFAEAFNRHLIARLNGEYPSLFTFLTQLENVILDTEIQWARLDGGMDLNRDRRSVQNAKDLRIKRIQIALASGRFTMQEFLDAAVNREVHEETLLIVERNQRELLLQNVGDIGNLGLQVDNGAGN